jgi:hypothetical protein
MDDEEKYKKELAEAGVDLPNKDSEAKAKEEADAKAKAEEDAKNINNKPPDEQKSPSIYDEYKAKKAELKSERELRETTEKERDELRTKLEALEKAGTPEEKQIATDDLEEFAKEINADPLALKKMRELFLKDYHPTDESLRKDLNEFKAWKTQNQQVLEKQMFENEYSKTIPTLKDLFPSATDDEQKAIKEKLDSISHTKEWRGHPLDLIALRNKDTLSALVSPKKRGMETKEHKDVQFDSSEFDPNADYSKMSLKEREAWEENYRKVTKSDGLMEDAQGRKLII